MWSRTLGMNQQALGVQKFRTTDLSSWVHFGQLGVWVRAFLDWLIQPNLAHSRVTFRNFTAKVMRKRIIHVEFIDRSASNGMHTFSLTSICVNYCFYFCVTVHDSKHISEANCCMGAHSIHKSSSPTENIAPLISLNGEQISFYHVIPNHARKPCRQPRTEMRAWQKKTTKDLCSASLGSMTKGKIFDEYTNVLMAWVITQKTALLSLPTHMHAGRQHINTSKFSLAWWCS